MKLPHEFCFCHGFLLADVVGTPLVKSTTMLAPKRPLKQTAEIAVQRALHLNLKGQAAYNLKQGIEPVPAIRIELSFLAIHRGCL